MDLQSTINDLQSNSSSTAGDRSEGKVAKAIESQTSRLPSDTFLWLAIGSMAASAILQVSGRKHSSLFVGQWAPAILIMGLYNKLVKVAGSDQNDQQSSRITAG